MINSGEGAALRVASALQRSELERLRIEDPQDNLTIPDSLRLSSKLRQLAIVSRSPGEATAGAIATLIEAIEWCSLPELRELVLELVPSPASWPAHADLGFLRELPSLEHLSVRLGIWHVGEAPSPIDDPSTLPRTLLTVTVDAEDPARVQAAFDQLGVRAQVFPRRALKDWLID